MHVADLTSIKLPRGIVAATATPAASAISNPSSSITYSLSLTSMSSALLALLQACMLLEAFAAVQLVWARALLYYRKTVFEKFWGARFLWKMIIWSPARVSRN